VWCDQSAEEVGLMMGEVESDDEVKKEEGTTMIGLSKE